jgi:hypothetical protein
MQSHMGAVPASRAAISLQVWQFAAGKGCDTWRFSAVERTV